MPMLPHHPLHARGLSRRAAMGCLAAAAMGATAWRWGVPGMQPATARTPPLEVGDDVCVVAPPTPYDPASGLPPEAPRAVPADARCPVCGMYPARARAWAAQVIFANGDAHFFDSPLSLLMYLGSVGHYTRGRSAGDIVARYVSDMDSGAWVDAQHAVYVAGSSAMGPMRAGNLPAFGSAAAAQRFAQQHGGRPLAWAQIDGALLRTLAPHLRSDHSQH